MLGDARKSVATLVRHGRIDLGEFVVEVGVTADEPESVGDVADCLEVEAAGTGLAEIRGKLVCGSKEERGRIGEHDVGLA